MPIEQDDDDAERKRLLDIFSGVEIHHVEVGCKPTVTRSDLQKYVIARRYLCTHLTQ